MLEQIKSYQKIKKIQGRCCESALSSLPSCHGSLGVGKGVGEDPRNLRSDSRGNSVMTLEFLGEGRERRGRRENGYLSGVFNVWALKTGEIGMRQPQNAETEAIFVCA